MDNGATDVIPSEYKEKIWGKTVDGEYVIDGFVFRGKKYFGKVVESLREALKRGHKNAVNGVEFRVLDTREKGVEWEIEVEMVENKKKGLAMLKLYETNKRKENVVSVNRSKGNDPEFVVILARKILKPLMNGFLKGRNILIDIEKEEEKSVTIKGKKVQKYKCPHCDKTSNSMPGLKGHVTKMHRDKSKIKKVVEITQNGVKNQSKKQLRDSTESETLDDFDEQSISKEADKVVNLLNDVIVIDDDECVEIETEDITLEEFIEARYGDDEKEYSNRCENCDYVANANKKFKVLQLGLDHSKQEVEEKG